jgi:hypothetical protein
MVFATTNISGSVLKDLINPELALITFVAEDVEDIKKLNMISPKRRYKGYLGIDVFDITPPKNKSIAKKDNGSNRYHKTPR